MHTLICVTFSLPPGVSGWLRLLLVALPGLSVYSFFFKSDPLSSLRFNPSACSERVQQCLTVSWVNPKVYEPRHEKPIFGSYRPGQTQTPAQLQKLARGLKLWLQKLDIILSRQRTTKTLIRLRMRRLICALVVRI